MGKKIPNSYQMRNNLARFHKHLLLLFNHKKKPSSAILDSYTWLLTFFGSSKIYTVAQVLTCQMDSTPLTG